MRQAIGAGDIPEAAIPVGGIPGEAIPGVEVVPEAVIPVGVVLLEATTGAEGISEAIPAVFTTEAAVEVTIGVEAIMAVIIEDTAVVRISILTL